MQFQTHNFHKETPEEIQTKPLARQAKTPQTTMGNQFRQEQLNSTDIVPEEQTVSTDWTTGDFFQSHADLESLQISKVETAIKEPSR